MGGHEYVGLHRKQPEPMEGCLQTQEAPVQLREAYVPAKASHCVWVLFISCKEKRDILNRK